MGGRMSKIYEFNCPVHGLVATGPDKPIIDAVEKVHADCFERKVVLDPEHWLALEEMVDRSEGVLPVSIGSLVAIALDAFIDGAEEVRSKA
jgi:hypothetical protein